VMLLLFMIGLEFSIRKLVEMKHLVLIGGGLQVILTVAATAGIAMLLGRGPSQAIFFGFLIALSSTAIVLKTYVERNEVDSPHGRVAIAMLLFQDICVVLMLLLLPTLAGSDLESFTAIVFGLGKSFAALAVIVLVAWLAIPLFLKQVVKMRSPEVFLLTIVLLALGLSWVTLQFGMSLALGAFIAGVVLADTDFSHEAAADILPFRDVFNSLFFVSIGMLMSLSVLMANFGSVLLLVVGLIAGKAFLVWMIVRILGYPQRISAMAALGLAQIGEFSFVLLKAGRGIDLVTDGDYQTFLAAAIISMIATPFLIAYSPQVSSFVQRLLKDGPRIDVDNAEDDIHHTLTGELQQHVIIVGYGLNGRNLARVLRTVGVPYIILELNADVVRRAKDKGERIDFGDATRREVLRHVGIEKALGLVLAMSDPHAARLTVKHGRRMNPNLHIIVRTRYVSEITELFDLGANEVIPEEFETSIEIFTRVLTRYGFARNVIESQVERVRNQGYEVLRVPTPPTDHLAEVNIALDAASTETVGITPGSPVVGKSLGELKLREQTGATVIAVLHDGGTKISPGANYRLCMNDKVVVLGDREQIDKAIKLISPTAQAGDSIAKGFNP
ncbi:MAG TPA: cation:proton antiporter, partial [Pyrinomonadaceae bacterium]|nr:cation:proton antiporter [Pyrinomonadaceae bacterium]